MKILMNSFLGYINKLIERNAHHFDSSVQIKIPSMALDFEDAQELFSSLDNQYINNKDISLYLKVSVELENQWKDEKKDINLFHQSWLLNGESLTYYRNTIAQYKGNKQQVLILLGADMVYDSGSLEHLLNCGFDELYRNYMNSSFSLWTEQLIDKLVQNTSLFLDLETEKENINRILAVLYKNSDLLHVGQYLDEIVTVSVPQDMSLSGFLLKNLDKMNFCNCETLIKKSNKKNATLGKSFETNFQNILNLTDKLFNGNIALQSPRQKAFLSKIDKIINPIDKKSQNLRNLIEINQETYFPTFSSIDEFLVGLEHLVNYDNIDDITIHNFRKCDFCAINNNIFKYSISKSSKRKEREKLLEGTPFEMILQAVLDSLNIAIERDGLLFSAINKIDIVRDSVKHNYSSKTIQKENDNIHKLDFIVDKLLIPALGGIDDYVCRKLTNSLNFDENTITCNLGSKNPDDVFEESSTTGMPCIIFHIVLNNLPKVYRYKWIIKDNNDISLNYVLANRVKEILEEKQNNIFFPVFTLKNYENCFFMQNFYDFKDEFTSALKVTNDDFVQPLLDVEDYQDDDDLLCKHTTVFTAFKRDIINSFVSKGIYSVLNSTNLDKFIDMYSSLINDNITIDGQIDEPEIDMFLRAFWIVDYDKFMANKELTSGILSLLHPAMLEEVSAKNEFIISYFSQIIDDYFGEEPSKKVQGKSMDKLWEYCLELSTMQSPLPAFIHSVSSTIDTKVQGEGLFYKIGSIKNPNIDAIVTTKIIKNIGESIPDSVLEAKTQESKLITKQICNFVSLYNYAQEGLTLTVVLNKPIQPVLAGIIDFIKKFFKDDKKEDRLSFYQENPYQISLQVISSESNEFGFVSWLDAITRYWNNKSLSDTNSNRPFKFSQLKTKFNIIMKNNGEDKYLEYLRNTIDSDFVILYGDSKLESVISNVVPLLPPTCGLKFPILQKYAPKSSLRKWYTYRYNIFINSQFEISKNYLNLIEAKTTHFLSDRKTKQTYLMEKLNYDFWLKVLQVCHEKSELVLCIGNDIDTEIIEKNSDNPILVGFGSGIGSRAELNYTISTMVENKCKLNELLSYSFEDLFPSISLQDASTIVNNIMQQKMKTTDYSIFRTLRFNDNNRHDFFGYMMTRRLLKLSKTDKYVCDAMISLDSYMHWFAFEDKQEHADLLWITAKSIKKEINGILTDIFDIRIQIIESKLAYNVVYKFKDKALQQIQSTEKVLKDHFKNENEYVSDSKYWWMQLYRIIVANMKQRLDGYPVELENLSSGFFNITWSSSIFMYERNNIDDKAVKLVVSQGLNSAVSLYQFSPDYIKKIALMDESIIPEWEENIQTFNQMEYQEDSFKFTEFDDIEETEVPSSAAENNLELKKLEENVFSQSLSVESVGTESVGTEPVEVKPVEVKPVEVKPVEVKPVEVKPVEVELVDAETVCAETVDAETGGTETGGTETVGTETVGTETVGTETVSSDDVNTLKSDASLSDTKILLGTDTFGNKIYWNFGQKYKMNNRHMFVYGGSGSGKTYATTAILAELAKNNQGSLIFDYNNAITPNQIKLYGLDNHKYFKNHLLIKNTKLRINPFVKFGSYYDDDNRLPNSYLEDSDHDVASRVANIIDKQFASIGPNQLSLLIDTIENGLNQCGSDYSLEKLEMDLNSNDSDSKSVQQLLIKIKPLLKANPFSSGKSDYDWNSVFEGNAPQLINVFQLKSIDPSVQKIIIDFCLWDLWFYVNNNNCNTENPKVVFLDEVQNLDLGGDSPENKYLKEGRKFGLNIIAATQDFAHLSKDAISSLLQSSTILFFQPSLSESKKVAEYIRQFDSDKRTSDYWENELSKLKTGQCFLLSSSSSNRKPIKIQVSSMQERGLCK